MLKNNVYLIPSANYEYTACISPNPPTSDAICLTEEGSYPTTYYYRRSDLNGDANIGMYECANQEELIQALNWNGVCHHIILLLWDFDYDKTTNFVVLKLFKDSYESLQETICKEYDAMLNSLPDLWEDGYEDDAIYNNGDIGCEGIPPDDVPL